MTGTQLAGLSPVRIVPENLVSTGSQAVRLITANALDPTDAHTTHRRTIDCCADGQTHRRSREEWSTDSNHRRVVARGIEQQRGGTMFEGFTLEMVHLTDATLRVRHGSSGPPVLLLHGHPRTHTTWHRVAPILAESHTVVCPDLRGFGRSSKPMDTLDHAGSSKRAKALDCLELMRYLGHDQFAVVGHDRGAYTAFRLAMDHPDAITHLTVLDAVPILEALERCGETFARLWWHWFFFAQPERPERAILADPDVWYGGSPERMGRENFEDFQHAIHDPATVHGMLEDYRAGLGIDREHDAADRAAGRRVTCPTLVLWSRQDDLEVLYPNVLDVWGPWATDLRGHGLDCGHHMAEEVPVELAAELLTFLE